ncbi:hypothetical protein RND81_05G232800 [Saponaria officinalis]|uniref:GDSL esterase/lipase n=1 Tax=Saponaria officinalis TaxID=3572 RepID=A0AAW1L1R5_SAPOF
MEAFRTLSFVCLALMLHFNGLRVEAKNPSFSAIYQFGDSISDTGNMVRESGGGGCGRPPYGETYFHYPTGRCSDGLIMIDHFAQAFRLPFLSPYLDRSGNFSHGVNFAVAGATALDLSYLETKKITAVSTGSSLPVQLSWFKSYLATISSNPSVCKRKIRNALFVVGGVGGNDYASGVIGGKSMQDLHNFVPDVVQGITTVVQQLIDLGARRIIVPGSFPVGCMPITLGGFSRNDAWAFDENGCVKSWNDLAADHNAHVKRAVVILRRRNPGVRIVYGDYFNALMSLFKNAASLGFDRNGLYDPCCGSCGAPGVQPCPNPNVRVSWDGIHMTQHAYQFVAYQLLKQIKLL